MPRFIFPAVLAFAVVAAGAASLPAHADVTFVKRDTTMVVDPGSAADFSKGAAVTTADITVGASSTGARTLTFNSLPDITGYSYASTGGVTVTEIAHSDNGDGTESHTIVVDATGAGSWSISENSIARPPFVGALYYGSTAETFGFPGNFAFIDAFNDGGGLLDNGGEFDASIVIPGDYSKRYSHVGPPAPGEHFGTKSPDWSVTSLFVYDPGTNLTTWAVANTDYNPDPSDPNSFSPELGAAFVGPAVPEPSSWALMIVGVGLVGASIRDRSKGQKPQVV